MLENRRNSTYLLKDCLIFLCVSVVALSVNGHMPENIVYMSFKEISNKIPQSNRNIALVLFMHVLKWTTLQALLTILGHQVKLKALLMEK